MRNKSKCKVINEKELENNPTLLDIKNLKFEKGGDLIHKKTSKSTAINSKIKKIGVIAIIVLIFLLYATVRLRI